MEIDISLRKMRVDSRDVLAAGEELDLRRAGEDEARVAAIRAEYEARRENLEQVEVYEFELGPVDFQTQWRALAWARKNALVEDGRGEIDVFLLSMLVLLYRITSWSGFEVKGTPLDCNEANKVRVFGQAFPVIQALQKKLAQEEDADRKNSGASRAG